jgi:hypothetical protein
MQVAVAELLTAELAHKVLAAMVAVAEVRLVTTEHNLRLEQPIQVVAVALVCNINQSAVKAAAQELS